MDSAHNCRIIAFRHINYLFIWVKHMKTGIGAKQRVDQILKRIAALPGDEFRAELEAVGIDCGPITEQETLEILEGRREATAKGVALVVAYILAVSSTPGAVQVVINWPKQIIRKARPTMAGLKIFEPKPPKSILAIPMATTEPLTQANQGSVGGTEKARIRPVTTAEK